MHWKMEGGYGELKIKVDTGTQDRSGVVGVLDIWNCPEADDLQTEEEEVQAYTGGLRRLRERGR